MKKMFRDMKITITELRCLKCGIVASDPDNPKIPFKERQEKYASWEGWLCKCGYYNGLDP